MILSNNEFSQLLTSSRFCETINFNYWVIESDDIWDFSLIDAWLVENLSLARTGSDQYSNWGTFPHRFTNLNKRYNSYFLHKILIFYFKCSKYIKHFLIFAYLKKPETIMIIILYNII